MKQFYFNFIFAIISMFFGLTMQAQDYPMSSAPITDCSGFFLDSGGNGTYGANENLETTICPDLSSGTHVQLLFPGVELAENDVLCFFDGEDSSAPNLACNIDFLPGAPFIIQATAVNTSGCITVTFNSDGTQEQQGWEADINCVPACQTIQSQITMSDPAIMPLDTGYIDICPGQRIFLESNGIYPQNGQVYEHSDFTSTFEWNFGDAGTGVGPNVSHTYEEPGGYLIQLKITDQFGCESTNFLSQRVRVSPTPVFNVGESLPDEICAGDTVRLNSSVAELSDNYNLTVENGSGSFQTEQSIADSIALPDGSPAFYESELTFNDFSPGQVLTNTDDIIGICVNMEHSYLRDLVIKLACPDGTEIILQEQVTNGGETFLGVPNENDETGPVIPGIVYEYCWNSFSTNGTWNDYLVTNPSQTLPAGSYNPLQSFDAFLGCPLNGVWKLKIEDQWAIDNGYIESWSIGFNQDLYPSIETFTPSFTDWNWQDNPSIFYNTPDSIAASPQNAGTAAFTFETTNNFGCEFDTTFQLNILPPTHPDCFNCGEQLRPAEDTTLCVGEIVNFDVAGEVTEEQAVVFETFPNYPLGKPNHPPANAYYSEIAVSGVAPAIIDDPITDIISVCVDFETNWNDDIQMILVSPSGQEMELSTNNGGGGDNYTNTCFTPNATTPITAGTPPFTGEFQPEGDWNTLVNESVIGTWSLKISDAFGAQLGLLKSWSISFRSENEVIYTWFPQTGLSCFLCPDPEIDLSETVTYTINAVDSYGCDAEDEVTVEVLQEIPAPIVTCSPDDETNSITLEWEQIGSITDYEINLGSGWMPISGTQFTQNGLAIGEVLDYEIRAVFAGGNCGIFSTVESCTMIADCDMFIESVDGTTESQVSCDGNCNGLVALSTFDAMSPVFYSGINNTTGESIPQQNGGLFTGLCPGSYTFSAVDAANCTADFNYTITEPDAIQVNESSVTDVSCFGGNDGVAEITVTGGSGPITIEWNDTNNQSGSEATFLTAGEYTATVTDSLNCTSSLMVTVGEPTELMATANITDVLCFGENTGSIEVNPTGGTAPYDFDWQDIDDGEMLFQGTYTVTVTDANDCEIIVTETVNEPAAALMAETTQTFVSCFETNESTALVTPTGGTGDYSYAWDNGDMTETAVNLTAGDHEVTVSDENGCEVIQFITIQQLDELVPNVITNATSCSGSNDGDASVNIVQGGVGTVLENLTFAWSSGATTQVANNLPGGTISVTVTDEQGCIGSAENEIAAPQSIQIELTATDPLCFTGNDGTATVSEIINGSGGEMYQWDAAAGNQTTATASNLAAGTYAVTVTDGSDCEAEASITINDPDDISVDFVVRDNECFGDFEGTVNSTSTGGTGVISYLWSNDETSADLTDLGVGVYYVTLVDENLCTKIDSAVVLQPEPIEADLEVKDAECFGERNGSITITPIGGTAPFLYSVNGEDYNGSSTQIGLTAGEYEVFVQDANGCTASFPANVGEPDPLELFVIRSSFDTLYNGDEIILQLGDSTVIDGEASNNQGPVDLTWIAPYDGTLKYFLENDSTKVETITQNSIYYDLIAVDSVGCTSEIQILVRVVKDRIVLVPTGFSPNNAGDASNEILKVHGKEGTTIDVFRVYDRWGELVFEAQDFMINDPFIGWDGDFRGKQMPTGVYVWYLEATYIDGNKESFKGSTNLVR